MESTQQPVQLIDGLRLMLQLQDLDSRTEHWEHQRAELNRKVEESRREVEEFRSRQEDLKRSMEEEKKKRGLLELEVKTKEDEIVRHNGQLYQIDSNEGYKAKLSEIAQARQAVSDLEDRILQLIENEDGIRRKFEEDAAALAAQTGEAEARQKAMLEEAAAFESKAKAEEGKREEMLAAMGKQFGDIYRRYHKSNRGRVVGRITEHGTCSQCRMKVTTHQINEVRKLRNLHYCQSCGVILVSPGDLGLE